MNSRQRISSAGAARSKKKKSIVLSIVILVEVIAILTVITFAWVETVSSIKIFGNYDRISVVPNGDYVFTDAIIGEGKEHIDLASYFRKSGDMHLAPATSTDGSNLSFPNVASTGNTYRKGTASDKNTNYLSISLRIKVETSADFFFTDDSALQNAFQLTAPSDTTNYYGASKEDIRISVTSHSIGIEDYETKVYACSAHPGETYTYRKIDGTTETVSVEAIGDHKKSVRQPSAAIFSIMKGETKIVTVSIWLLKQSDDMSKPMSQPVRINSFGLVSDLTPRHVTLIPGSSWDFDNAKFYAWCWESSKGESPKLFLLKKDVYGYYGFDYNGTYSKMVFVRVNPACNYKGDGTEDVTDDTNFWNYKWSQTDDTTVPNSPVDPTYIIKDHGSNGANSPGSWALPAMVRLEYVNDQDSTWGTISGVYDGHTASYIGTNNNIEYNQARLLTVGYPPGNSSASPADPAYTTFNGVTKFQTFSAIATPHDAEYAFEGWFTDPEGTTPATGFTPTTSNGTVTSTHTPPAYDQMTIYYAKFKEVRTITLYQYLDGTNRTGAGTIKVAERNAADDADVGTPQSGDALSKALTVDLDAKVRLSATANTGYTLSGIYDTASASGTDYTNSTFDAHVTQSFYAVFTTNTHSVSASVIGSGGTVTAGNAAAGATSTKTGVPYNSAITLEATPSGGYEFVGWYTDAACTNQIANAGASYSYTLNVDTDVTIYAKFKVQHFYLTGFINGADVPPIGGGAYDTYELTHSSGTQFTYTMTFTTGADHYFTVYNGVNAYHPGTPDAGSGTQANSSLTDTTPSGPNGNKWLVAACANGSEVTFTWDTSNNSLSWTINKRTIYLKAKNWGESGARYAIYAFDGGTLSALWYNMTSIGNSYYKATINGGYNKIIFGRMKGDSTTNNFNNPPCWNQTGDITLNLSKNSFRIDGYSYGGWEDNNKTD